MHIGALLFLTLSLSHVHANASSADAPQVILIEGSELKHSTGDSIIERNLLKLRDDYGVHITKSVVTGYILDTNDNGTNRAYDGYDISAKLAHPFFAKSFHSPIPQIPESKTVAEEDWAYATKGIKPKSGIAKVYSAAAIGEIDHVYFGASKFGDTVFVNRETKASTDSGFESILHEALHLWHNHHYDEVTKLLHSKGSYFDRVKASNVVCKDFASVSGDFDTKPKPACGFATHEEAMNAVIKQLKWPQRYGAQTKRRQGQLRKGSSCPPPSFMEVIGGKAECFGTSAANDVGDMHAFDSEFEYFAILMQLAVFSPDDFKRVATPGEVEFAKAMFRKDFGAKLESNGGLSAPSKSSIR